MGGLTGLKVITGLETIVYMLISWHCVLDDHGDHMKMHRRLDHPSGAKKVVS